MDAAKSAYFKNTVEGLPDEVKLKPQLKDEEFARGAKGTNGTERTEALS